MKLSQLTNCKIIKIEYKELLNETVLELTLSDFDGVFQVHGSEDCVELIHMEEKEVMKKEMVTTRIQN